MTREEWLARRREGIGGSDWTDVLNLEPYGCQRKAWYDKTEVAPDYPIDETGPMKRGRALEPLVAQEVSELTGRPVRRTGRLREATDLPSWWLGNPDYRLVSEQGGPAVVECKTANEWVYRKVATEGIHQGHIAQVQHYIARTGWGWGVYALLEPSSWDLYTADMMRNDKLIQQMIDVGGMFWRRVENGPPPDRLMPDDKRCRRCPWRRTCQGQAVLDAPVEVPGEVEFVQDAELEALIQRRQRIKEVADEAKEALDSVNSAIKRYLGRPRKIEVAGGVRVYLIESVTNRLDTRQLRKDHPLLEQKYLKPTRSVSLRVYNG